MSDIYDGPVGFGSDGVHYPVDDDGHHLDTSRPLFWVADDPHQDAAADASGETHPGGGYYRDRAPDDPTHSDAYHVNLVDLDFGGETVSVPPEDAEAVRRFLADKKGAE